MNDIINMRDKKFVGGIMFMIMMMIIYSDYFNAEDVAQQPWIFILLCIGMFIYVLPKEDSYSTVVMIIMAIYMGAYTIYQWEQNINLAADGGECSSLIPISKNFLTPDYLVYKIIFYLTLLTVMILMIVKLSKISEKFGSHIYYIVLLLPLIIPFLTEILNVLVDSLDEKDINPESLLINFLTGGADKSTKNKYLSLHFFLSILFYIFLMVIMICSTLGKFGFNETIYPIWICLTIMVCFSIIMKYIFVQDCSVESAKDVQAKTTAAGEGLGFACKLEKYGGLQILLYLSLVSAIIYHIKSNRDRVFTLIIIISLTYGLSESFILAFRATS